MSNQIVGAAGTQLGIIAEQFARATGAQAPQGVATQGVQPAQGTSLFSSSGTTINFNNFNLGGSLPGCCAPSAPAPEESTHPAGSLKVDDKGVVTTPGGYKIEATKQHEWTVTGPDGKSTRVWGDPHVAEGDGGKWDFKRNSTFVLGDGTRINCTTKPWKDGKMTVTDSLEILAGNERVNITGISEGKGKTGEVTQDGFQRVNAFGKNDVFVMGKETDDWSFGGKEIVGSENGGESFKLGGDLAPGATPPAGAATPASGNAAPPSTQTGALDAVKKILEAVSTILGGVKDALSQSASQPTPRPPASEPITTMPVREPAPNDDYLAGMRDAFRAVAKTLQLFADLLDLRSSVRPRPVAS